MSARGGGEGGASLVGLVVVLLLLGGGVALALSSLAGDEEQTGSTGSAAEVIAGGTTPSAGGGPAALVDAASVAACRADVATLETALASAHAALGHFPATLTDLVASGFVSEVPFQPGYTFTAEVVGGSPTGRVLVNGRPGGQGCDAPAPSGR